MSEKISLTILGSGTSTGVPIVGCSCHVCQSTNPKNNRLRPSLLINYKGKNILIDSGPDIRAQLLRNPIDQLDALIITHEHADHTQGIDDLRVFTFKRSEPIKLYSSIKTCMDLKERFAYIFNPQKVFGAQGHQFGAPIAKLQLEPLNIEKIQIICDLELMFHLLPHGHTQSLGIIHSSFAYLIDCVDLPDETISYLQTLKLDLLILDCARRKPTSSHLHLKRSLELALKIRPRKLRLTHLSHDFDHNELENELATLPFEAKPTYDGEKFYIEFQG